jgi:hypothetical protein
MNRLKQDSAHDILLIATAWPIPRVLLVRVIDANSPSKKYNLILSS